MNQLGSIFKYHSESSKSEVEADVTAPPPDDDVVTESDAIEA